MKDLSAAFYFSLGSYLNPNRNYELITAIHPPPPSIVLIDLFSKSNKPTQNQELVIAGFLRLKKF